MTIRTLAHSLALAGATLLALPGTAWAAGTEATPRVNERITDFAAGKKALNEKRWAAAIDHFNAVVAKEPSNADAFNFLGYAYRWQNRLNESLAAYGKALSIDPKHLGANEYLGQAYLKQGDKGRAQEQLQKLQALCGTCQESDDLASAIKATP
jgi:cytochrome c-type biogenesis protein CcmH/NrfG